MHTIKNNRIKIFLMIVLLAGMFTSCADKKSNNFNYKYADVSEGIELMLGNTEYYEGLTANDLEYKMQKKNATLEEYKEFAKLQVLEFSEEEKKALDECMASINEKVSKKGKNIPPIDQIVFIKTTQEEECGSSAYTHGTQIYLSSIVTKMLTLDDESIKIHGENLLWHEIFHCLTRCNPDFRKEMYKLINFTVQEEDYKIPPSVLEYFISNPDVERHNSSAVFDIGGKQVECFTALVTTKHFEKPGDSFFECMTTALVPVDGTDIFYTPDDAVNFNEIFGINTGYVIDPEECLADNFGYAMTYGVGGPDGSGYPTPEIIEGMLDYMQKSSK